MENNQKNIFGSDLVSLGPRIDTQEQAKNWIIALVAQTEDLRKHCDVLAAMHEMNEALPMRPPEAEVKVQDLRRAFFRWLLKRGESLGALIALQRTGKVSDVTYSELRTRILSTQAPTLQKGVIIGG